MPRIRTVKPEFWEDELLGVLPRDARLLFIATFNMADDEGILRWTPAYIKAQAFMYDDDLTIKDVEQLMQCLADVGLVFPYIGGAARQQMALVVNFRKHQRINRPQKGKLPPPSLGNYKVRDMYARRDGWTCQLCGGDIPRLPVSNDAHNLAIDHIRPASSGGTDHPSNVRAVHQVCGRERRHAPEGEEFIPPRGLAGLEDSVNDSVSRSLNESVNIHHGNVNFDACSGTESDISSLNNSLTEGKGREGKRNREGKGTPLPPGPSTAHASTVVETGKPLPDRMTDAFLKRFSHGNAYGRRQVRGVIANTLTNGVDPDELWQALERLGDTSKPVSAGTLQFAFADIRKPVSNVIVLPGQQQPLTGTDAKVAGWDAIATELRAKENPA